MEGFLSLNNSDLETEKLEGLLCLNIPQIWRRRNWKEFCLDDSDLETDKLEGLLCLKNSGLETDAWKDSCL
jgi:hypothetical protein